jgi:tripartite-type tricarboxylate transporter receptor subunit TctC
MKLGFDPVKDLTPIALLVVVPNVIAVAPTVAASNVQELVAEIKAKPGGFSCGSSGIGSTQHLACEAFALATGHEDRARAVQGLGPGADRPRGGPDPARLRHHVVRDELHQGRAL